MSPQHQTAVAVPSLAPQTLGGYALLAKVASGGMATVYVGSKRAAAGFERLVAIKCCHPHLRDNQDFVSMFMDEARLAASIRHPNVVATLDVGEDEFLYLVMEYVEGCSLANLMRWASKERVMIPPAVAVRVMIETLSGLHAAHELRGANGQLLNLVHRDVSPHNILIGLDGVSRITDFGIAFATARSTVTQEGLIKGKFSYLAPEQVKGHPATRRMDLFSAGTVLWEALAGRPLFRRSDDAATLNAVMCDEIPAPSSVAPHVPAALDAIVLRALSRVPEERYETAADFAAALDALSLEHVTARKVGAQVERAFGAELAQRREDMRSVPLELPLESTRPEITPSRVKLATPPPQPQAPPVQSGDGSIEHRRLRGLLAAAMLLLVGSALGLLLARAEDNKPAPSTPPPPNAAVHTDKASFEPATNARDTVGKRVD